MHDSWIYTCQFAIEKSDFPLIHAQPPHHIHSTQPYHSFTHSLTHLTHKFSSLSRRNKKPYSFDLVKYPKKLPSLPLSSLKPVIMDGTEHNPKVHNQSKAFHFFELALRLCVIPFTLSSLLVMVSNNQTSDLYGTVQYNNISGFKYLVSINAISGVYCLSSIVISKSRCFKMYDWVLFVLDQVMTYLMVTSGSAVSEVLYLTEKGNKEVSWSEVCSYFGSFCHKTKVSLGLHFVALVCFIVLSLISAFRLFSKFDSPSLSEMEENGEKGAK